MLDSVKPVAFTRYDWQLLFELSLRCCRFGSNVWKIFYFCFYGMADFRINTPSSTSSGSIITVGKHRECQSRWHSNRHFQIPSTVFSAQQCLNLVSSPVYPIFFMKEDIPLGT
ncbi:hypothetical protein QCA50_001160 [Cerrena zonata]|uniref:Uncharacterized protein n=1 Tax=Cerrena zonata TaxID=2478898 RepID=A0AAW0GUP4_9APHY